MTNPSAIAYFFKLDRADGIIFDAYLDVRDYEDFSVLEVRYRVDNSADPYSLLIAEELRSENMATGAATDAEVDRCLAIINAEIARLFGEASTTEPAAGIARVKWLLQNGRITESGNVLTRK